MNTWCFVSLHLILFLYICVVRHSVSNLVVSFSQAVGSLRTLSWCPSHPWGIYCSWHCLVGLGYLLIHTRHLLWP